MAVFPNRSVLLYDAAGVALAVQNGVAIPAATPALIVAGSDGAAARYVRTAADGTVRVDPTGTTTQPVGDAGASLTVDTPQLPVALVGGRLDENVGAWLGSTAPTVGQKAMASSVPVVVASDQSALTVKGQDSPAYAASTNGSFTSPTVATTVASVAYLFHPSASAKRVQIEKIVVSWSGNGGNNLFTFRCAFLTAENGAPGGTSQAINALDQADAASALVFRTGATGAPTRVAGDLFSVVGDGGSTSETSIVVFDTVRDGKAVILRAGVAEGFEVRFVVGAANLASAVGVSVYYVWTEV